MLRSLLTLTLLFSFASKAWVCAADEPEDERLISVVRTCVIRYDDGSNETVYPATHFIVRKDEGERFYVRWTKRGWIDKRNVTQTKKFDVEFALRRKQQVPCRANTINYGSALYSDGQYELAKEQFQEALDTEPDSAWSTNAMGWLLSVCPDDSLRDGERAIELCTAACESTDWKESMFISNLACAYAEAGQYEEAMRYIKKALLMDLKYRGTRAQILKCIQEERPFRCQRSMIPS